MACVAALAACGDSDDSGSNGASGGGDALVDEAKTLAAEYEQPQETFNLPPLESAPPTGKTVAVVVNNIPESHEILVGAQEAAEALGWTTIPIVYDPSTPTGMQDAFAKAVDENPDGVITQAADTTAYAQAAEAFAAKDIPVVTSNTTDEVKPPIVANVTDAEQVAVAGRLTAAYVVAEKGADANVAIFNVPSFSILQAYESAFEEEFSRLCPDCDFKSVPVQPGDIGTKVPAQVVSTVQTNPDINVAVMGFGAVSLGVAPALKGAGITSVDIVGEAPAIGNVEALIKGDEKMWIAFPLRGIGWKSIDALARFYVTGSAEDATSAPMPYQILTEANVSEPAALPEVADYQQQFKDLWQVG
jgi:ABC-type sugar transport system substrate-binding protein